MTFEGNGPPQGSPWPTWLRRLRVVSITLLVVYWLSMFIGTHIPKVPEPLAGHSDKLLHLSAYFGLSVLLVLYRSGRGRINLTAAARIWLLAIAYGAFDEITQPLTGRDGDFVDWFADCFGAAIGVCLFCPLANWVRGKFTSA